MAVLFKRRHRRGQKMPRGHRGLSKETWSSNLSEIACTCKRWPLGNQNICFIEQTRAAALFFSLSYEFNFKYIRYLRKWWNQCHCILADTRMHPSVHHHFMAPSKTSHTHLLALSHLTSTAAVSSNPSSSLLDCYPSAISLHVLSQNSPWYSSCPTVLPPLLAPQPSFPPGQEKLHWDGRTFCCRDIRPVDLEPCYPQANSPPQKRKTAVFSQTSAPQPNQEFVLPDSL